MRYLVSATALAVLSFTSSALAQLTCPTGYLPQTTLQWNACTGAPGFECTTITVPLDYSQPLTNDNALTIPLVRRPARNRATAQTIITNPGGPGSSGIVNLLDGYTGYMNIVGYDNFHIMSFDPRGVGLSAPYNCDNVAYFGNKDLSDQNNIDDQFTSYKNQAAKCDTEKATNRGEFIGTSYVARDINAMFLALGEGSDKLIRYWGYSYGTVLGATLGQMFPLRVKNILLDGNVNPDEYWNNLQIPSMADNDKAVENFFDKCSQSTESNCAWKSLTTTRTKADLLNKWTAWAGIAAADGSRTYGSLGYNRAQTIEDYMFTKLYVPEDWKLFSQWMEFYYGDASRLDNYPLPSPLNSGPPAAGTSSTTTSSASSTATHARKRDVRPNDSRTIQNTNAISAIRCGDTRYNAASTTTNSFTQNLKDVNALARYVGDQYIANVWSCATWLTKAKEQNTASWAQNSINTLNAILIVQTLFDPITPLNGATKSNQAFTGSVLLTSSGAGHCSNANPSSNLDAAIGNYFTSNTFPDVGARTFSPDQPNPFIAVQLQTTTPQIARGQAGAVYPESFLNGEDFQKKNASGANPVGKRQASSTAVSTTSVPAYCTPISLSSTTTSTTTTTTTTTGTTTTTSATATATTGTTTTATGTTTTSATTTTTTGTTTSAITTESSTSVSSPTTISTTVTSTIGPISATTSSTTSTAMNSGASSSSTLTTTTTSNGSATVGSVSITTTPSTTVSLIIRPTSTTTMSGSATIGPIGVTTSTRTTWTTVGPYPTGYSTGSNGNPVWDDWKSWMTSTIMARPPKPSDWNKDYEWAPIDGFQRLTKTLTSTWVETITKCPPTVYKCPYGSVVTKTTTRTIIVDFPTTTVYVTPIVDTCETGITTNIVTITATCHAGCVEKPTGCPEGYTTTKVWCEKCAIPTEMIVTRKIEGYTVNAATTWADVAIKTPVVIAVDGAKPTGAAEWSAYGVPLQATGTTWSTAAVATPVKPTDANWAAVTGVRGYTGGAAATSVSITGFALAFIVGLFQW